MNKIIICITSIIIAGSIIVATTIKVVEKHHEKLLLVDKKLIIEKAKDCINEKKCSKGKITLKTLNDKGYLKRLVNKVTKEYYNPDSYVLISDKEEFVIVP